MKSKEVMDTDTATVGVIGQSWWMDEERRRRAAHSGSAASINSGTWLQTAPQSSPPVTQSQR